MEPRNRDQRGGEAGWAEAVHRGDGWEGVGEYGERDRDPVSTCPAFDIRNPVGGSTTSTSRPERLQESRAGLTKLTSLTGFPLTTLILCCIPVMDRRRNPFVPGTGLQPPELAGRDRLLENATIDMDRVLAGRPARGLVLLGLRGVGKTVLLNRLRTLADDMGFRTVRIETPEGSSLPELLTPELRRILFALDLRRAAGHRLQRAAGYW